jgi:hypothetical protein
MFQQNDGGGGIVLGIYAVIVVNSRHDKNVSCPECCALLLFFITSGLYWKTG